jgi:hypothetical protein
LDASLDSDRAFDDIRRFLDDQTGKGVLFSAEVLFYWLSPEERQEAFVRFLAAAQEVTPTRCVWTLRRYDEMMRSIYLLRLRRGAKARPPRERPDQKPLVLDPQFAGLRLVEEAVEGDVVYVKYDPDGGHNAELLRALGVDDETAARIERELSLGPRLHAAPSHKQAVSLLNLEALSARAGVDLDGEALRNAFLDGSFEFEEDWRCELADLDWQQEVHQLALAAARRNRVTAYVEFFDGVELQWSASSTSDLDAITEADLERLVAISGRSLPPRCDQRRLGVSAVDSSLGSGRRT